MLGRQDAEAYPRVLGHSGNTLDRWPDFKAAAVYKSKKLYHTKTVTQHLSINDCFTLPGKHYVVVLKGNFPNCVRKMFSFSKTIWTCAESQTLLF